MITHLLKDETWYIKDNGGKGSLVGIASTRSNWFVAEEVLKKHAPLIAAAPEMLDALIELIKRNIETGFIPVDMWKSVFGSEIKVIEKATGLPIEEVLK